MVYQCTVQISWNKKKNKKIYTNDIKNQKKNLALVQMIYSLLIKKAPSLQDEHLN